MMHTRNKLKEAKYFLDLLLQAQEDSDKFDYILSAFLTAWRSVLDVMLYDFCEHYSLGFTRDDEMNDKDFEAVANALIKHEAKRFIIWWRKKQGMLRNSPLWRKRTINIHRGPLNMLQTFVVNFSGSGGISGTLSKYIQTENIPSGSTLDSLIPQKTPILKQEIEYRFADFPDDSVINICVKAYEELEKIVREAEEGFNVHL